MDGEVALRIGQVGADTRFLVSRCADPFVTFGWPDITGYDSKGGGSACPLAAATPSPARRSSWCGRWSDIEGRRHWGDGPARGGPSPAALAQRDLL